MDASLIYAIIVGGLLILLTLQHVASSFFIFFQPQLSAWVLRHLVWPVMLSRRRFTPRITRFDVVSQICYWSITAIFNTVGLSSLFDAGLRAGLLAVFQMVSLMAGNRLSFTADMMGLSYRGLRYIHHTMGLMAVVQATGHIFLMIRVHRPDLRGVREQFGLLVGGRTHQSRKVLTHLSRRAPLYWVSL